VIGPNVTIAGCTFTGNTSVGQGGALLISAPTSLVQSSTFTGNTGYWGGAVAINQSDATLLGSTFSGNTCIGWGGGAVFLGNSESSTPSFTTVIRNCTISANSAAPEFGGGYGGGIAGSGELLIQNSTIVGNTAAAADGGGGISLIDSSSKPVSIISSIVAGNTGGGGPDIKARFPILLTASAVGSPTGFSPAAGSGNNLPYGIDLRLAPLAYNGGPTQTHAILSGSQAIDKGANPDGLATDQRGPGFPRVVGPAADIGAYEVPPVIVTSVAVNAGQANLSQRSIVTSLTVTFASRITFSSSPVDAFQLTRTGPVGPFAHVMLAVDLSGSTATQTVARLTFSGPLTEGPAGAPSLVDGNYTLTVVSNHVNGGVIVGNQTATLYRLFGDVNGDRAVNGIDMASFRGAFGTSAGNPNYVAYLDQNGDGAINGLDLAAFRTRFGTMLP
jgi:hypothetical protein